MIQVLLNHRPGLLTALGTRQRPTSKNAIPLPFLVLSQTTLTIVYVYIDESDSDIAEESKSHLAIPLRLALALGSRETRKETLREYLKET